MGVVISLAFIALVFFFLLYQRLKRTPGSSRGLQIAVKCAATSMAALVALLGCLRIGAPAHWLSVVKEMRGILGCVAFLDVVAADAIGGSRRHTTDNGGSGAKRDTNNSQVVPMPQIV